MKRLDGDVPLSYYAGAVVGTPGTPEQPTDWDIGI
jgi:hypothetical protein